MDDTILEYIEKSKGPIYMTASAVVEEMIDFHHHMATHVTSLSRQDREEGDTNRQFHREMGEFWKRVVIEAPVWTENGMLRYITELLRKNEGLTLQLVKDPDVPSEQVQT